MGATLSSLNIALERVWTQKTLEEQLYQEAPFLDKVQKTQRFTVGELARVPLHVSRNSGYTPLPAGGGALNAAGNQGLAKAEYNYTNHHMQVSVQGDAIDGTAGSSNAIVQAADLEIKGALTDLRRQLNRQLFMNGDALIAICRTSATNDVDLNTSSTSFYNGTHALSRGWIYVNQLVDVGTTSSETAILDAATVTAVNNTATNHPGFTSSSGNVTTEGTTHYVSQANARAGTTSYEMNGLANAIGTGTFGGLTSTAQPLWQSTVDATAQPLSLASLLTARTAIYQASGEEPDFLFTSPLNASKIYQQVQQQIRYTGDDVKVGNLGAPRYLGIELNQHPDCQDLAAYVGKWDAFFMLALDKPYFQNKITGGEILAYRQGYDEYVSKLTYRCQLGMNRRNTAYAFNALT